ncbi:MAG: leucine-rich repeat protein, partial [Bacteroidaceae bacterium]|nr:leucine-rich repeat protein [Bacteroidaceae bacterium]
ECEGLTSVTIPGSVVSIGYCAFLECPNLKSVTIGNGLTSMGEGAFAYCNDLTSMIMPRSLTNVGDDCFKGCTDLYLSLPYEGRIYFVKCGLEPDRLIERNYIEQDVNNDGNINSGDVVSIYNCIIDPDITGIHPFRADTNLDGAVNSGDVVDIYNAIINGVTIPDEEER